MGTELFGMTSQEAIRFLHEWAGVVIGAVLMLGVIAGMLRGAWNNLFGRDDQKWGR